MQIVDIATVNYSMQQIVSGGTSHLYPLLKNVSKKVFCKFGSVVINSDTDNIEIYDSNLEILYKEPIMY